MKNHLSNSNNKNIFENVTSQLALSILFQLKKKIFATFPITNEENKVNFLSIINEKEIDSEKLSEYLMNLKFNWKEIPEIIYLTNEEIIEYLLYSFEFHNKTKNFIILFKNLLAIITNLSNEYISKLSQKFYSNKDNKSNNLVSWLNFNCNMVSGQLNNKFYTDILFYDKEIYNDQCLYINLNLVSSDLLEIIEKFFVNRKELIKVNIYISNEIKINSNEVNFDDLFEKIIELIFIKLSAFTTLDFFSFIVNHDIQLILSEKNFSLLISIMKKNKANLEIIKIDGINFNEEQKSCLCDAITEYTYFDKLKILNLQENFSEEIKEKFNDFFIKSNQRLYIILKEYEKINF